MLQIYYKVYEIPVIVETKCRFKVPPVPNFIVSFQNYIMILWYIPVIVETKGGLIIPPAATFMSSSQNYIIGWFFTAAIPRWSATGLTVSIGAPGSGHSVDTYNVSHKYAHI